jgi:predicted transcriptional regulator
MRERDEESRRLMRIERATGIERKELKIHLEKLVESGYISHYVLDKKGRGGHPIIIYNILNQVVIYAVISADGSICVFAWNTIRMIFFIFQAMLNLAGNLTP